jgi:DUF3089 family protein
LSASRRLAVLVATLGCAATLTACSSSTVVGNAGTSAPGPNGTTWLCRPGLSDDPCKADLDSTAVGATGTTVVTRRQPTTNSRFDCFYVYPTVSTERTLNADLTVQPAETDVAMAQASPFSQVCNVWAPMYRQQTLAGLALGFRSDATSTVAYDSLLSAWRDYIANDNDGRPIIFIGHSQGAAMLIRLLQTEVDPDASRRQLLVSAILLGGNVTVPIGGVVGGSFRHIPACQAPGQVGCVVAYSSFLEQPPADSYFGIPGQGVSLQAGTGAGTAAGTGAGTAAGTGGLQVLCVDPANPAGGTGALDPMFPASSRTEPHRAADRGCDDAVGRVPRPLHRHVHERQRRLVARGPRRRPAR